MSAAARSAPARTEAEPISRAELAAKSGTAALALGALGVVFGDIGTSPLYAVQAVFNNDHHAVHTTTGEVYGVLSLIFWSITMIVSVGYVSFIMRADDKGEGGVLALTGLLQGVKKRTTLTVGLITLGVLGAALFFGDSMITPAISVLSAVEGLKVAVPSLASLVLPIAIAVLTGLFFIQRFGTGVVGKLFGPVMLVWFTVLALIGLPEIVRHPESCVRCRRATGPNSSSSTGRSRSSRWRGSCWPSPGPRRCMPTWATSAALRSGGRGSSSCSRR